MQRRPSVACDADVKAAFEVGHGRPIKFDERLGLDTASQSNLTMRNAGRDGGEHAVVALGRTQEIMCGSGRLSGSGRSSDLVMR
jgi:hypothetical protein